MLLGYLILRLNQEWKAPETEDKRVLYSLPAVLNLLMNKKLLLLTEGCCLCFKNHYSGFEIARWEVSGLPVPLKLMGGTSLWNHRSKKKETHEKVRKLCGFSSLITFNTQVTTIARFRFWKAFSKHCWDFLDIPSLGGFYHKFMFGLRIMKTPKQFPSYRNWLQRRPCRVKALILLCRKGHINTLV